MNRRHLVTLVGTGLIGVSAGCLSTETESDHTANGDGSEPTATERPPTPTETPVDRTETPETNTPTETVPSHEELSREPSYGQRVTVTNRSESDVEVTITIRHARSGTHVYDDVFAVEANDRVTAFEFSEIEDEYGGIRSFEVTATLASGESESTTTVTNACYGGVRAVIESNGELVVKHAIC